MHNSKTHTNTVKKKLNKCASIFKAYSDLQYRYGNLLDDRDDIKEIKCNVPIECDLDGAYTTDFYCIKIDGSAFVRECVWKSTLLRPLTIKTLDASRNYWLKQGITDWGLSPLRSKDITALRADITGAIGALTTAHCPSRKICVNLQSKFHSSRR